MHLKELPVLLIFSVFKRQIVNLSIKSVYPHSLFELGIDVVLVVFTEEYRDSKVAYRMTCKV